MVAKATGWWDRTARKEAGNVIEGEMQFGRDISAGRALRWRSVGMVGVLAVLSACDEPLDIDMRSLTSGFDTTTASAATPA